MEVVKNFLCSSPPFYFPPRTHHRTCPTSPSSTSTSTSVLMLHEQAVAAVTSRPMSITRQFPTSVLLQDQREPVLQICGQESTFQGMLVREKMDTLVSVNEEKNPGNIEQSVKDFRAQLHHCPGLSNLLTSLSPGSTATSSVFQHLAEERFMASDQGDVVSVAKKALSTSKIEASMVATVEIVEDDYDSSLHPSLADSPLGQKKMVKSIRLLERRSKKRKVPLSEVQFEESYERRSKIERKKGEGIDQNDPVRLFSRGSNPMQLLTHEQESELIVKLQGLMKLEEVKRNLHCKLGREPTLVEWANCMGLSCRKLQSELHAGFRSREKLISRNLRMVAYVAKKYQGRGLSLEDLMQEGSMGLIMSIEKFKPQAGRRFGNYAYWWIKLTIRKAIFQHSRTIRLPRSVYTLLGRVKEAKKAFIQEGNHYPTKEDIAKRVGITLEKYERLLCAARVPISMEQTVSADNGTTFQEIIADPTIETPEISVAKQLMRRHVRSLLRILSPKQRRVIRLRFGMEDGEQKSITEVGKICGVSIERVRQLETKALYKLKRCAVEQGLDTYAELLS